MRRLWCQCGTSVDAQIQFAEGAYEATFFDLEDRTPIDDCPGCDEELYPMFTEGTLNERPPKARPKLPARRVA